MHLNLIAVSFLQGAMAQFGSVKQLWQAVVKGFRVMMPIFGATLAVLFAQILGFSTGGTIFLATLVPTAMLVALTKANHSLSIISTMAVAFPFNVLSGIPLYSKLIVNFEA